MPEVKRRGKSLQPAGYEVWVQISIHVSIIKLTSSRRMSDVSTQQILCLVWMQCSHICLNSIDLNKSIKTYELYLLFDDAKMKFSLNSLSRTGICHILKPLVFAGTWIWSTITQCLVESEHTQIQVFCILNFANLSYLHFSLLLMKSDIARFDGS